MKRRHDRRRWIHGLHIVIAGALVACGGGDAADDATTARASRDTVSRISLPDTASGYGLRLRLSRGIYAPGDTVRMELVLYNRGDDPMVFHFPTAQRYDFLIRRGAEPSAGDVLWRWSEDRFFTQATGTLRLHPDRPEVRFVVQHPAPDSPGIYRVEGRVPASDWPLSATVPITVTP